jgi:hypothetical protein
MRKIQAKLYITKPRLLAFKRPYVCISSHYCKRCDNITMRAIKNVTPAFDSWTAESPLAQGLDFRKEGLVSQKNLTIVYLQ